MRGVDLKVSLTATCSRRGCRKKFRTKSKTRAWCSRCLRTINKRYKKRHPDRVKKQFKQWVSKNKTHVLRYHRRWALRLKRKTFALFGSVCHRCDFGDIRALQIDHKNGARGMRQSKLRAGAPLYAAILRGDKNPKDFQLLCANCNWIKRFERKEH